MVDGGSSTLGSNLMPSRTPVISYAVVDEFEGWEAAREATISWIRSCGARRVLEIGSGANPTLDAAAVRELGLEYTVNDVSAAELEKAPAGYERLVLDFSQDTPPVAMREAYDFVFSRMVNEHVADGSRYYANIREVLSPGGCTVHWFSTLYALPFLANRIVPEWLGEKLLDLFQPRDRHRQGKFKAYYSWSRGPTRQMIGRFASLGFEIHRYVGYFGHSYYRKRLPALDRLERAKAHWLARHPLPWLTSYAMVVLGKPPVPFGTIHGP